ncbi:uncharacterized protein LOC135501522 [Lineus longissimus]|uniref:uncharacterized protein LOC135501522 n=1 Tax=Lineus longissimus TaxID=88925 RepID=UPI002B4F293A
MMFVWLLMLFAASTVAARKGFNKDDWSVYHNTGAFCDTMVASTTVKKPYLESCLKFCHNYVMEFCMVEIKENKGKCLASAKCDSFRPSNTPKESFVIYKGPAYGGGKCTIPERFHGDWWVYEGPMAFTMKGKELNIYENNGADTKKFRCEFQTNDVVLLKYTEMVKKDGKVEKPKVCCDFYVCFRISRFGAGNLKVEIITNNSHDESGMYLVPYTKGITMGEVCSGNVSEVHLLMDRPSPAMQPAIEGELGVE